MKRTLKLYLAGPITGCGYGDCTDWREYVQRELGKEYICLSPMRSKTYLKGVSDIAKSYEGADADGRKLCDMGQILSSNKGINRRDSWDCQSADVILMNLSDLPENKEVRAAIDLLRAQPGYLSGELDYAIDGLKKWLRRISIGSMFEAGMSWAYRVPLVAVLPKGNIHEHPMLDDIIHFRCDTLDQSIQILRSLR